MFHVGDVMITASDNKKRINGPFASAQELLAGEDGKNNSSKT